MKQRLLLATLAVPKSVKTFRSRILGRFSCFTVLAVLWLAQKLGITAAVSLLMSLWTEKFNSFDMVGHLQQMLLFQELSCEFLFFNIGWIGKTTEIIYDSEILLESEHTFIA